MKLAAHRVARLCAAILAAGVLTAAASEPPASAATGSLVVVNSASFLAGPVPAGALLTIFTPERVSGEQARTYNPWVVNQTPDGVAVEASCGADGSMKRLPIRYLGWHELGSRIDVYYPNSIGPEPFGPCVTAATSQIRVLPAPGFGNPIGVEVAVVLGHPGIFAVEDAPDGTHTDGYSRVVTNLAACTKRLPGEATLCPVRHYDDPGELRLLLTGSDAYLCNPCVGSPIVFELAPAVNGVPVGPYTEYFMATLIRKSVGVEEALIYLYVDTPPGEYLIRVHVTQRPEMAPPRRVEFGQPLG